MKKKIQLTEESDIKSLDSLNHGSSTPMIPGISNIKSVGSTATLRVGASDNNSFLMSTDSTFKNSNVS
jgi:hypothetical protein